MTKKYKSIGVVDEPIDPSEFSEQSSDTLGVKHYAKALQNFVEQTDTPMTIGIQGEWGSGKTSLLKEILQGLEGKKINTKYQCFWIDAWEHSLLKKPEETLISIINEISNGISELNPKNSRSKKITNIGKNLLSGAVKVAAGITMGEAGVQVADGYLQNQTENSIKKLRLELQNFISETIEDKETSNINNIEKIVFFIDDLDRLEPKNSLKIIELLKNIFSTKHCVFILAIDYQVIVKGLEEKFGKQNENNEREFRSFFDKIIQLPFTMPINSYDVSSYILNLLEKIEFIEDKNSFDQDLIIEVLKNTIGSNPRSIKRLINSISLIRLLNDIRVGQNLIEKTDEKDKVLIFSLVCCQVAYPKIYDIFSQNINIQDWDDNLAFEYTQKKEDLNPNFKGFLENAKNTSEFDDPWEQCVFRICYNFLELKPFTLKIVQFLRMFVDGKIEFSDGQINEIFANTSATAVTVNDNFKYEKAIPRKQLSGGFDNFKKSIKFMAKDIKIDENIIEKNIDITEKIHLEILKLFKNNEDFKYKFYRESLSYYINNRRFAVIYPKTKSNKISIGGIYKDYKNNFMLPKISNEFVAKHHRPFSANAISWQFAGVYRLDIGINELDKFSNTIMNLLKRSAEILQKNEKKLEDISNLADLNKIDFEKISKMGAENYVYVCK